MPDFTISKRRFHFITAPLRRLAPKFVPAEPHCRKFSFMTHLWLSLAAQLLKIDSANTLLEELNDVTGPHAQRNLRQLVGFDFTDEQTLQPVQLNQSSFSRANQSHSYSLWRKCWEALLPYARQHCQPHHLAALGPLVAIDGTLFDCLARMVWATYTHSAKKVKGHVLFDLSGLPTKLVLTTGTGSEREVLRQALHAGITYLMDRGYNDYALFLKIQAAQADFVTRMLKSTVYSLVHANSVSQAQQHLGILSDQLIQLNTAPELLVLRRVEWRKPNGEHITYLTSRTDIEPYLVVCLYQNRWQIERFFAWIKQHLQVRHWYSENENGMLIQLYAALITYVLLKLFHAAGWQANQTKMSKTFVNWVQRHLFDAVSEGQIRQYLHALGFAHNVVFT